MQYCEKADGVCVKIRNKRVDTNTVKENRDQDRELFAKYVIVGWSKVVDAKNEEVAFTQENAEAFLHALPDWIFDGVRNFAGDCENFIDDPVDTESLAKD